MRLRTATAFKLASASLLAIASATALWARPDDGSPARAPDSLDASQAPASRPSWRGGGGGPFGGGPATMPGDGDRPGFGRRNPGDNWRDQPPPSNDEWDQIESFMRENSPIRLSMYERVESELGGDARATQAVRRRIAARYRDLNGLKDRNNDLYGFALKQLKIEDGAMGTLAQIRRSGDSAALRAQLQSQMRDFVKNSLDERDARLARLRDFVSHEESSLLHDRADLDTLQAKQQERFEREMKRMLDFSASADSDGPATKPADAK